MSQNTDESDLVKKSKDSTQSLKDSLRMARESQNIANNVNLELGRQGDQLKSIKNNMSNVNNNIDKSSKSLTRMERKWYDPRHWF